MRLRTSVATLVAAIVTGCAGLGAFAGAAWATGTLDQSQTIFDAGFEGLSTPSFRLAQTFTAGLTGSLDQVDLLIARNGSPGDLTVEIRSASGGVPSTTVLASAIVSESSVTPGGIRVWVSVPFNIPAGSIAGT